MTTPVHQGAAVDADEGQRGQAPLQTRTSEFLDRSSAGLLRVRHVLAAALLLSLACGYPLAVWLPPSAGWENHWIENLQVLILAVGCITAFAYCKAGHHGDQALRSLSALAIPIWLVMIGRELSWGAVFLDPIAMRPEGPFYSSSALPYRAWIRPVLSAVALVAVVYMVRIRFDRIVWRMLRGPHFPFRELSIACIAALGSTYAEGHLFDLPILPSLRGKEVVLEEWMEVVAYVALAASQLQAFLVLNRRNSGATASHTSHTMDAAS